MAYDIFSGRSFESSELGLSLADRTFDSFVAAHRRAIPAFRLLARIADAYGDADFAPTEVAALAAELLELEQQALGRDTHAAVKALRLLAQESHAKAFGIFCRGD